jgi:hypothetical protein
MEKNRSFEPSTSQKNPHSVKLARAQKSNLSPILSQFSRSFSSPIQAKEKI